MVVYREYIHFDVLHRNYAHNFYNYQLIADRNVRFKKKSLILHPTHVVDAIKGIWP